MQVITVAARKSPLSEAQLEEVFQELIIHHQNIVFEKTLIDTSGDLDKKTSLRDLGKTDFFTKEIDELLIQKKCRIAIHSAKDLPDPLPLGLTIIALTKGVDTFDSLVLQEGISFTSLSPGAVIATSSINRENNVKGATTPLQGKLAIVANEEDDEMRDLFRCIDTQIKV